MKPAANDWEVGGDFPLSGLPRGRYLPWPRPSRWFALARHAVTALAESRLHGTLWVPDYFCADVALHWRACMRLATYVDDPLRAEPDWSTLKARTGDAVLAMNYFGSRTADPWSDWRRKHKTLLIEDHTHDPFSPWAKTSQADFAFASVRKLLPVPDGAILWSPRRLSLPPQPAAPPPNAAARSEPITKFAGMALKREYLSHPSSQLKQNYRRLLQQGELDLIRARVRAPSAYSAHYREAGYPAAWRTRRGQNAAALRAHSHLWPQIESVTANWPTGAAPFGYVIRLKDHAAQARCRRYLEQHNVYCPIHWPQDRRSSRRARELAATLLTIPLDHRYRKNDMLAVARLLARFR